MGLKLWLQMKLVMFLKMNTIVINYDPKSDTLGRILKDGV